MDKDLDIIILRDINWGSQVDKASKNPKSVFDQIRNNFKYLNVQLVKLL